MSSCPDVESILEGSAEADRHTASCEGCATVALLARARERARECLFAECALACPPSSKEERERLARHLSACAACAEVANHLEADEPPISPSAPAIGEDAPTTFAKRRSTPLRIATTLVGISIAALALFALRAGRVRDTYRPQAEPYVATSTAQNAPLAPGKDRETDTQEANAIGHGKPELPSGALAPVPPPITTLVQKPIRNEPTGAAGLGASSEGSDNLSTGDILAVVQKEKPALRRTCWDATADADTSSGTAKVTAKITIGKDGRVASAQTTGADTIPGLSECVAREIRKWRFPKSSSETKVNVPFVFARS